MSLVDVVQDWGTTGYSGEVGARDWGRGYTARAVEAARLGSNDPLYFDRTQPRLDWTVVDRFISTTEAIEREFEMRREKFLNEFGVDWMKAAVPCKQNQSLDTAKLDEFLDEM